MLEIIGRELGYLFHYFGAQMEQIAPFWGLGIVIGSLVSVFVKGKINSVFLQLQNKPLGILGLIPASLLGIASPLCMYGTIPIAASFSGKGMRHDWLAAFMMSSMLLNPQLLIYTSALGNQMIILRLLFSFLGGIAAGICVRIFFRNNSFFNFEKINGCTNRDTHPKMLIRLLLNIGRNIKATGLYFFIGIVLAVLFQRYLPHDFASYFLGKSGGAMSIVIAALIGVPLYVCGGGTIPILLAWLQNGMSPGSAVAFMISGPGTKVTNLGALKIVFSSKKLLIFLCFILFFAIFSGLLVDMILNKEL